jgi:hypothetical protein
MILTQLNMPYIPQEILDKIIGYATADEQDIVRKFPNRALISADEPDVGRNFSNCAASLVSHTFHQIVLPYKFRSVTFLIHSGTVIRGGLVPKFCEAINAGDPHALSIALLVQELSLFHHHGTTWQTCKTPFVAHVPLL